jgi:hypothetical protein
MSKTSSYVLGVLWGVLVIWQPSAAIAAADDSKHPKAADERGGGAVQQRREALRAALRAQRTAADVPAQNPNANRQLTPAERAELRQQLGQQRRGAKNGTL